MLFANLHSFDNVIMFQCRGTMLFASVIVCYWGLSDENVTYVSLRCMVNSCFAKTFNTSSKLWQKSAIFILIVVQTLIKLQNGHKNISISL